MPGPAVIKSLYQVLAYRACRKWRCLRFNQCQHWKSIRRFLESMECVRNQWSGMAAIGP